MKINRSFTLLTILLMITLSSISSSQNPINLSALNFASLPTYQLTSLPTYQLTNLPAYQLTSLWSAVDSLIALGQPRSALEIVEKIYQSAKSEKNDPQIIKSIIYRIRLNAEFQENFLEKSIADLKKEIAVAGQPAKQILQSILAEVYWKYYQNNEYRFRDRTLVAQNQSDSIATWDLATIYNTIARTYLFSLENQDTLKKTPIGKFLTIIECDAFGEKKKDDEVALATKFLPTLYDFLAGRAVEFFTSQETAKIIPAQRFEVDQKWYFDPTLNFIRNPTIIPADTASPASFAIRLFRNLAAFHFEDKERCAIIAIELKRLDFVHEESVMADKDSLYLDALKKFEQNEIASHWSTSVSYTLADFYNNQGQRYQPLVSNQHKWDIRSAVEICDKAIKRFPGSEGAKNCGILKKSIRIPALQITAEKAVPVGKPSLALIRYKNLNELNFRLVKTDPEIFNEKSGTLDQEAMIKYLTALKAEKSWLLILPNEGDYQSHSLETKIPEVPSGSYILLASSSSEFTGEDQVFTYTTFWSTQISYISRRMENGSMGYFMLDRVTGLPLKNVRTEAWVKNYNYQERQYRNTKLADYISDNRGSVLIPPVDKDGRNSNLYLKIWYNDDFFITGNFYQYPVNRSPERTFLQTMFYTDRAIYRPGQTIYFKGIILEKSGEKSKIKSGYSTKVVFTDVNGQKISEQTLTTNEFGSVHGSFIAPQDRLPGAMTISNESGSAQVLIESYKLPTFDVTCDPLEGNYKLGEKLNVTGKALAYAGNAIAGAAVKYRVVRTARFPWIERFWYWPVPSSPEIEITNGTTSTDAEGKFGIGFTAIPDLTLGKETKPVYAFTIFADVTDLNGETQSVQQAVSVGYTSLIIGISLPEKVDLATDSVFAISATNLNGRPTPTQISATLSLLRQPDRPFKPREWERPDRNIMTKDEFHASFPYDIYGNEDNPATWIAEKIIFERTLNTRTDSILHLEPATLNLEPGTLNLEPATLNLEPGTYLLLLKATDPSVEAVEMKRIFTVFSSRSKEIPENKFLWFAPLKTSGEPGEKARFQIGSKEDNVNVLYEITCHDSLISREWIKMNDQAMLVETPITEQLRGDFAVNFVFVKQNRVFQQSQIVNVPYPNRKLNIKFESFRNKIEPGAKETWKISIAAPTGKPAFAEFLAGMYDASLDVFRENQWSFNIYERFSGMTPWDAEHAFSASSGISRAPNQGYEGYSFHPNLQLNWFGFNYFYGHGRNTRYARGGQEKMLTMDMGAVQGKVAPGISQNQAPNSPASNENTAVNASTNKTETAEKPKPKSPPVQVRRDFRETAFFYPSLITDSTGNLVLQFTAPESLTRWKMLGLAHTQNLEYDLIEKELITQKELMVFPNAPRFVRQGDTVIFSAKVANLSSNDLSGNISLDLSDAITLQSFNKLIDTTENPGSGSRIHPMKILKSQSVSTSWKIIIPVSTDLSVLRYRVTAVSGAFSDGEEKAIPVLTNRMLVTESLPLPVRGKGTTSFLFRKLTESGKQGDKDSTLKNHKLTLEFASNPAWYAIQALPTLNDQQYETADAIFSAYWSNSVAYFIANSNPRIMSVFEAWKTLSPDALKSNLSKNEQLKSALLQETPWVMEANTESERKQKLGIYFDANRIEENLQTNFSKLIKLQTPNGGWAWMPGMRENRYTTQAIVTGFGKLHHLGIKKITDDPLTRKMALKAISYLDKQLVKDYIDLKKYDPNWKKNNHVGATQIQYFYARSFFMNDAGFQIPDPGKDFNEAFEYFKTQSQKYWLQQDRYIQGMIAIALHRLGNTEIPALILKSQSEKALHSDEMGMYWASDQGYYWYQAPLETQTLMIEAYDEVSRDEQSVEEMKIWLLKQKQTQSWRSSRATLEACYSLLLRGTDLLDPGKEGGNVTITLGNEKIDSDKLTDVKKEAGTGYFQVSWMGNEIKPDMGKITVSKSGQGVAWGAVYWQYFENIDKITSASTPLHLEKKLFVEVNTPSGPQLEVITKDEGRGTRDEGRGTRDEGRGTRDEGRGTKDEGRGTRDEGRGTKDEGRGTRDEGRGTKDENRGMVKIGDKIVVRIVLTVDRDLEFVQMKDMRASGLEPNPTPTPLAKNGGGSDGELSGYRYQDGLGYYQSTTDVATNFFFDYLPKGTYVFEYGLKVNAAGDYSNGITTIQCMYAPEFAAHSEGIRINVK